MSRDNRAWEEVDDGDDESSSELERTNADLVKSEIFIAAFSPEEVQRLLDRDFSLQRKYTAATAAWDAANPVEGADSRHDWYMEREDYLRENHGATSDEIVRIKDAFISSKQAVFDDLALRLRSLVVQLRSATLLEVLMANETLATEHKDPGLNADQYSAAFKGFSRRYGEDPSSYGLMFNLEAFSRTTNSHLSLNNVGYLEDTFKGNVNDREFLTSDGFFQLLDFYSGKAPGVKLPIIGSEISFYVRGNLEAECVLKRNAEMGHRDVLASPLQFAVSVPTCYKGITDALFRDVTTDYADRITSPGDFL